MPKGLQGFQKGHKDFVSKEGRLSSAKKNKGRKQSPEWRAKIGAANSIALKGKKHSKETRKKMSAAHLGKPSILRGRFGEKANAWKGGRSGKDGEYQLLYQGPKKVKQEHRIVIESSVGRKLLKREVVHHWDEDKQNNDIKNLALLRNQATHQRLHLFAKRHGLKVEQLKFEQPWLFQK